MLQVIPTEQETCVLAHQYSIEHPGFDETVKTVLYETLEFRFCERQVSSVNFRYFQYLKDSRSTNASSTQYFHAINPIKTHNFSISSVQSSSVMSDSLQPHGLEHARPPCPSPTPRTCSNLCPSREFLCTVTLFIPLEINLRE